MENKNGGFIMAKIIKRAGMIFFVSVISCLIALGCILTMQVAESNNNGIVNADTQNNIYTSQNIEDSSYTVPKAEVPEVPKSDYEYELGHKANCTNQTTCTCMQDIWNSAVQKSLDTGKNVKVTLLNDWIAYNDSKHSFGVGVGFGTQTKTIYIPNYAYITLDLNGFTIDKLLAEENSNSDGNVIIIHKGVLNIVDSSFVENVINSSNVENLNDLPFGKIKGASGDVNGGAIHVGSNGVLNFYSGIITGNYADLGAGIYANGGELNIYGGLICDNKVSTNGAGIYAIGSKVNVYNCHIINNHAGQYAGGIYVSDNNNLNIDAYFYMYDGVISNNNANYGVGVSVDYHAEGYIYGGSIINNNANGNSAGILVFNSGHCEMYGGIISENKTVDTLSTARPGGSGVLVSNRATFILHDGEISKNIFVEELAKATYGAGIFAENHSHLFLKSGYITGNQIISHSEVKSYGGGINCDETSLFELQGPAHVYGNTEDETASDVYLRKDTHINISDRLQRVDKILYIGIKLAENYGDKAFTSNYSGSVFNSQIHPSRLFFSSNTDFNVEKNSDGEVTLSTTNKPTANSIWQYTGKTPEVSGIIDGGSCVSVPYTGEKYTLSTPNGKLHYFVNNATQSIEASSYDVTDVGSYAVATTNLNLNYQTFTFTILPAEVDIKWENSELVYNGGSQKPTAYIAEDANCKVTVIGEQINSGSGYVATATGLSNKNYKINSSTMNKMFSISKAKLEKPKGSGTFEYDGSEKEYIPNGYNNATMNITGNKATAVGNYNATISLKDKHNYMWNDGGVEDIILSYSVTLTPPIDEDNSEYKFIYIDNEDGKQVRKTYKQGGLVHGINDSGVNGGKLVIGNVKPNTSVKSFIQTLGFEQSKITIKDSKGKDIFKDGNPVDISKFDNGKELAVGTGWSVEYQNNGNTETIYISVLGDVNGDGRISASDVTYLRQIASDNALYESLSVEKKLASMVINKGNVTSADAEIVKNVINKMFGIDIFF